MSNNSKNRYVYALLDPRKSGKYKYGKYVFNFEPFYIGKGTGGRIDKHFADAKKSNFPSPKNQKIRKIFSLGLIPIKRTIKTNMNDKIAFLLEEKLINLIGKKSENKGPLTNLANGGIGPTNFKHSKKARKKIKINNAHYWLNKKKPKEIGQKISKTKRKLFAEGKLVGSMTGKHHKKSSILKMKKSHKKGFKWTENQKENLRKIRRKYHPHNTLKWIVISPRGKKYIVWGLMRFCIQHNLSQSHMFSVSLGVRKHHKRWKCIKVQNRRKK